MHDRPRTLSELAGVTGGRLVGLDGPLTTATMDTRRLVDGQVFVALRAERDGHHFLDDAARRGAVGALVSADHDGPRPPGLAVVEVTDPLDALTAWAAAARQAYDRPVIGITGSVGKTSARTATSTVLAGAGWDVTETPASWNNQIGVPLTLIAAADHGGDAVVLELGARLPGDIAHLTGLVRPTVAVVTAVAEAHLETLGSLAGVQAEKGALVEGVAPGGTAVLNVDDPRVAAMASRAPIDTGVVSVGESPDAEVRIVAIELDDLGRVHLELTADDADHHLALPVTGRHWASIAALAVATGRAVGVDVAVAVEALADLEVTPSRMQRHVTPDGVVVLDDAYNANPASVASALRTLAEVPAGRRVAVLGQMAELGEDRRALHRRIATLAEELGIEVVAVDEADYGPTPIGLDEATERCRALRAGDIVLVKASRVAGLERLVTALIDPVPS